MSDTRQKGLAYLQRKLQDKPTELVSTSRFFPPEKSWTKKEAWWFNLPIKKIRANKEKEYYLLGARNEKKSDFVIVKVPNKFFIENLKRFETRYNNNILLHLDAYKENWLVDGRGKGKVDFSRFEVE
jgi:hypothetical protein